MGEKIEEVITIDIKRVSGIATVSVLMVNVNVGQWCHSGLVRWA